MALTFLKRKNTSENVLTVNNFKNISPHFILSMYGSAETLNHCVWTLNFRIDPKWSKQTSTWVSSLEKHDHEDKINVSDNEINQVYRKWFPSERKWNNRRAEPVQVGPQARTIDNLGYSSRCSECTNLITAITSCVAT